MEIIKWFSYNKKDNIVTFISIDFLFTITFLRGKNFKIKELNTLINNEEISLLNNEESSAWINSKHYIDLSDILEENDKNPICYAIIELENNGLILYDFGSLTVKYPLNESLEENSKNILIANGYYSANMIWDFCNNYHEKIPLDFILCMEEKDITDEFKRMVDYNY